jgi:hypothetical protein
MKPGPGDRHTTESERDLDARLRAHFAAVSTPLPDEVVAAARARIARGRGTGGHRSLLLAAALTGLVVVTATVMSGTLHPDLGPTATATPSAPATASIEPTSPASPPSSPTLPPASTSPPGPTPQPRCPDQPFDRGAALGPEFLEESFLHDESKVIAEQFLGALTTLYARDLSADACDSFTDRGLEAALAADRRLRAALAGETSTSGRLVLRGALENPYDLRERPPVVRLDVVFDLEAGATFTDVASGAGSTSTADERIGYNIDFLFDGHVWRAADVGPVSEGNAHFAATPAPIFLGPPCELVHDPPGSPFNDRAQVWCSGDGRRLYRTNQQYNFHTRWPCDRGQVAIFDIGRPLGQRMDPLVFREYVRDPADAFLANGWLTDPYDGEAQLPVDAVDTGWTNGNIDLWLSPSEEERAIYMVRGDVVERWPRAIQDWGRGDCN